MKYLTLLLTATLLILSACDSKQKLPGNLYQAEYEKVEGMPYNIMLNKHAEWERTDSFPEFRTLKLSYPLYEADGILTVVMVDSARLLSTMDRFLYLMEIRSDTSGVDISDHAGKGGVSGWAFTGKGGKEQIQWMATDSSTMYVAGNIHFKAATDSNIDITDALANIKADIAFMLENLDASQAE